MQDFLPLGTGNSRFLKSSIAEDATWEQARDLFRKGMFPTDIGPVNDAGVAQKGDSLGKTTLLQDATAALFGGDTSMVPDEVFQKIHTELSGEGYLSTKWKKIIEATGTKNQHAIIDLKTGMSSRKRYLIRFKNSNNYDILCRLYDADGSLASTLYTASFTSHTDIGKLTGVSTLTLLRDTDWIFYKDGWGKNPICSAIELSADQVRLIGLCFDSGSTSAVSPHLEVYSDYSTSIVTIAVYEEQG